MRIRFLAAGILFGGLALLAWTEDSRALLIDDFSADQTLVVFAPTGFASSQVLGSGILGGERDMELTLAASVGISMAASGADLTYGQIANSQGSGRIVWDGADGDPAVDYTGLGSADFTDGGVEDRLAIPLVIGNFSAPIVLTAYTDATNFSTATVLLPGRVPPLQSLIVLFTDFAVAGGTGADFTDIGAFSLYIDGSSTPGLAVGFDLVPEPSTGSLLLFGILMLASIRRYRWAR